MSQTGTRTAKIPFEALTKQLMEAAQEIFSADSRVYSVGIGQDSQQYIYKAIRNNSIGLLPGSKPLNEHKGIPVRFIDADRGPENLVKVPHSGPGSPTAASMVPEQANRRPLVCGLQIENYDDDVRTKAIESGHITVGTLGCFVQLQNNKNGILSNNHVVAGENRGNKKSDRILQPGTASLPSTRDIVGKLEDFVEVKESPDRATIAAGNIVWNEIDAGTVALHDTDAEFQQIYLPRRNLRAPVGYGEAHLGDKVFKVGRTTGLTRGEVTEIAEILSRVPYAPGPCWFKETFVIEGLHGTMFANHGDSGSVIVREDDGKIIGLLFAGNGEQTWACRIDKVLEKLQCDIL